MALCCADVLSNFRLGNWPERPRLYVYSQTAPYLARCRGCPIEHGRPCEALIKGPGRGLLGIIEGHPAATGLLCLLRKCGEQVWLRQRVEGLLRGQLHGKGAVQYLLSGAEAGQGIAYLTTGPSVDLCLEICQGQASPPMM